LNEKKLSWTQSLLAKIGFKQQELLEEETEAPNAFTYSLFYVFYDQYTYIRGVLAQNALLGTAAIILALQVLGSL